MVSVSGIGLTRSLQRVRPFLNSDFDAITMAFTQRVSGRYPEQRGNGLKFVIETVMQNNWDFFFQSGTGCCNADSTGYKFTVSEIDLTGCLAILKYK